MQTFLPYPNFKESARVLDRQRLGKQRVECYQISIALKGYTAGARYARGWRNHPATKMWDGYLYALYMYYEAIVNEWMKRGYKHNMGLMNYAPDCAMPPWLGDPAFHASHRSNLLRKDPMWYGQFGWSEPPDMPYVWPV